jgi:hypothetical protein
MGRRRQKGRLEGEYGKRAGWRESKAKGQALGRVKQKGRRQKGRLEGEYGKGQAGGRVKQKVRLEGG